MKKLLLLMMALVLSLSLVACGGNSAPAKGGFTGEQQALAKEFLAATEEYDKVVERINADPELLEDQTMVDNMNALSDAIIVISEAFENPKTLTPEVMSSLQASIDAINNFVAEANAILDGTAVGGGERASGTSLYLDLFNSIGADIHALAISPANSEDWGENLISDPIKNGEGLPVELILTEDTMIWDILVQDANGNELVFMGVDFSGVNSEVGAILALTVTESGKYVAYVQTMG